MIESADSPGVLIFPPFLFGGALLFGLLLDWLYPIPLMTVFWARAIGVLLFVVSAVLAHLAQRAMRRVGTNIRPDQPTLALALDGPFRFTRNPLYLAAIGMCLGVAFFVDGWALFVVLVPVMAVLHWGVVLREERYLEAKFGDTYREYRRRVRRWL